MLHRDLKVPGLYKIKLKVLRKNLHNNTIKLLSVQLQFKQTQPKVAQTSTYLPLRIASKILFREILCKFGIIWLFFLNPVKFLPLPTQA
jgi:hypothetical protein